ncbi:MAG TPA: BadF/BadG/BcrA/BcrD ATPase family protein [Vicinamibacteria bacterium]
MRVMGIDAGGTKTTGFLADESGRVLAEVRAGAANLHAAGEPEVERILRGIVGEATGGRGHELAAVCVGMAGAERDSDQRAVVAILKRIGILGRALVVNDAFVALSAGVKEGPGIVLVSGTGSIVYGRSARGLAARAGGFGRIFGDEASGYWLGRRALQAVARASDGRGPSTLLTPLVLRHFGATGVWDLVQHVNTRVKEHLVVSALAPVVEEARAQRDDVAAAILEEAARELVTAASSVTHRLSMREDSFGFVLAGGAFKASPWLAEELVRRLPAVASKATVMLLEAEPAQGAVWLALAEARSGVRVPAYVD